MATTSTFASRSIKNPQPQENLFHKVDTLQALLQDIRVDLSKLDEEAKSVREQKDNMEAYLDERSEKTRVRLMGELRLFEDEVKGHIESARKETAKIDEKINVLKQGQVATMQMILSLQRRVREIEVQLGCMPES